MGDTAQGTYDPMLDTTDLTGVPADYATSLDQIAPGTTGVIQQQGSSSQPWYETLASALPLLIMTEQQRQLLQVQVDRAKQGLPPLDVSQYGAGVNVGLSQSTQQMFWWLGAGVVALGALVFLAPRRR
jgi:hypothetical protein